MDRANIENLILIGINPEIISFEFNIPIHDVLEIKNEWENSCDTLSEKYILSHNKMENIRKNYQRVYYKTTFTNPLNNKGESLHVTQSIKSIERILLDENNNFKSISVKLLIEVLNLVELAEKYQFSIMQAERMFFLIDNIRIENLPNSNPMVLSVDAKKRTISRKLLVAIDKEIYSCDDIIILESLLNKINDSIVKSGRNYASTVISKINSRIEKLRIDKLKKEKEEQNIKFIESLCISICEGNFNLKNIKFLIFEEAKKRNSKNINLSVEEAKNSILHEIINLFLNESYNFKILYPDEFIENLTEVLHGNLELAIRTTVKYFVLKGEFEVATRLCDDKLKFFKSPTQRSKIFSLKKEIKHSYISSIILKCIKENVTLEEERLCIAYIEDENIKDKINLSNIFLGKNKENSKTITLSEIYY